VTGSGRTTYTWNFENRLSNVSLSTGVRISFLYDADGRRVRQDDSTGTLKFIWDKQNVLLETNASDITTVIYTQEPLDYGNLLSQRRPGGAGLTQYYHFDGLGSTDRVTDGSGNVKVNYVYYAFGTL